MGNTPCTIRHITLIEVVNGVKYVGKVDREGLQTDDTQGEAYVGPETRTYLCGNCLRSFDGSETFDEVKAHLGTFPLDQLIFSYHTGSMKLIISGTTPSKKNSRINTRSGRSFPSKRFSTWETIAVPELQKQFKDFKVTEYPISLTMVFFNGDLRRHDLDNQCSSILDTLVKAGVIEDDNQKFVDCITLQYGGLDRIDPRAEIFLDE